MDGWQEAEGLGYKGGSAEEDSGYQCGVLGAAVIAHSQGYYWRCHCGEAVN